MKRVVYGSETDRAKYIYHYTSAETAIKYILATKTLRFGSYSDTNDPYENKRWKFHFASYTENCDLSKMSFEEISALSEKLNDEIKINFFLACFSTDGRLTGDTVIDIHQRGYGKPRMWAQYGDGHEGVCLIFNQRKLKESVLSTFQDSGVIMEGGVNYLDNKVVPNLNTSPFGVQYEIFSEMGLEKYAWQHVRWHYKELFFTKNTDWKSEAEYRVAIHKPSKTPVVVDISGSLEGIVFGNNCDEKNISLIVSMFPNINYEQIVWDNWSPWYSFRKDLNQ